MGKISELLFPLGLPIAPNVKTLGTRYAGPLAILKPDFEFMGSLAVLRSLAAIPLARGEAGGGRREELSAKMVGSLKLPRAIAGDPDTGVLGSMWKSF
jgi:hypothetical protein